MATSFSSGIVDCSTGAGALVDDGAGTSLATEIGGSVVEEEAASLIGASFGCTIGGGKTLSRSRILSGLVGTVFMLYAFAN